MDPISPTSPSGHTTFFLSAASSARPEGAIRRRPGLTFAQQMGLLSQNASSTSPSNPTSINFGGRLGVGVGMGGTRSSGHGKVDQITFGRLAGPISQDQNPFLDTRPVGLASPGATTTHRPHKSFASPLEVRAPRAAMLSPPSTRKITRFRTPPQVTERQRKKEEMKRMMDAESNPFLAHPGELIHPGRAGLLVDESRPTVTYVFRGAKKVFANPFLRPDQPFPAADLDPEDDEFEPHPCPAPRLLWASGEGSSSREQSPPTSPIATPSFSRRDQRGAHPDVDMERTKHAFTDEEAIESESEEEFPARRGLLFAPSGGEGIKRALKGGEGRARQVKSRRL